MNEVTASRPRAPYRALTEERKRVFLEELRAHGIATEAARVASPHSTERHGALSTFRNERVRDPAFAAAWDSAVEEANGVLERECWRRAVEGVEQPVVQKAEVVRDPETGKPLKLRVYSDRLAEVVLKGRLSRQYAIEQRKFLTVENVGGAGLVLRPADLAVLDAQDQRDLARILRKVAVARGELPEDSTLVDITPERARIEASAETTIDPMADLTDAERAELEDML